MEARILRWGNRLALRVCTGTRSILLYLFPSGRKLVYDAGFARI
jgi:hypothetical protein